MVERFTCNEDVVGSNPTISTNNFVNVDKKVKIMKSKLKEFMSAANRDKLGNLPTTHQNCRDKCGVSRPGKTAKDRKNNS